MSFMNRMRKSKAATPKGRRKQYKAKGIKMIPACQKSMATAIALANDPESDDKDLVAQTDTLLTSIWVMKNLLHAGNGEPPCDLSELSSIENEVGAAVDKAKSKEKSLGGTAHVDKRFLNAWSVSHGKAVKGTLGLPLVSDILEV